MKMKRQPSTPWQAPRGPERPRPALRFTPYAWAKLLYLRDRGGTEIGGFGLGAQDDPLLIEDVLLVRQRCTAVSVDFLDDAVAAYFEAMADRGLHPRRFARVWVHTHPGESASPSLKDEATFAAAFGRCDWAVMAILARGGEGYARLRFTLGPQAVEKELGLAVAFDAPFSGPEPGAWAEAYDAAVTVDRRGLPWEPLGGEAGDDDTLDAFLDRLELSEEGIALLGGIDQLDLRDPRNPRNPGDPGTPAGPGEGGRHER